MDRLVERGHPQPSPSGSCGVRGAEISHSHELTQNLREKPAAAPPAEVVARFLSGKKGPNQELPFLRAVRGMCEASKSRGLRTLPFSKEAVGEEILEIMEVPFFAISEAFVEATETVKKLIQFQPPLGPDLRSSIVAWALLLVVSGSPGQTSPSAWYIQCRLITLSRRGRVASCRFRGARGQVFPGVLRSSCAKSDLPRHPATWLQSSCPATRSRAASLSSCLLHFAGRQPSFKIQDSAAPGTLLVQLAVSLVDLNTQGTETLCQLHRLLLYQRGLVNTVERSAGFPSENTAMPRREGSTRRPKGPRWDSNPGQPWKERYLHLLHVGKVFWGRLTQTQKEALSVAAWGNVSHLAQDWMREGSLVLLYSRLGRAHKLLEEEEEEEDLRMSLSALL
uniref:Uncharacterized protein n=1 Tax=Sphaerodactylus townsendi TaxID=933632 RepID=A0ACB8FWI7_9SAUR